MRYVFGRVITELAEKDKDIIVIVGDIGYGVFDDFRKKFPDRFLNVGTIEQSMVGIAAGMALKGLKPWVYTITPFLFERALEQIKIDIVANWVNVKLVGYCDYPEQGITHQALDVRLLGEILGINTAACLYPNENSVEHRIKNIYETRAPYLLSLTKLPR